MIYYCVSIYSLLNNEQNGGKQNSLALKILCLWNFNTMHKVDNKRAQYDDLDTTHRTTQLFTRD